MTSESSPKRTFPIRILGRQLAIQSGSEEDHVQNVADLVNQRMIDIRDQARSSELVDVAILAALNLADEYLKAREQLAQERSRLASWAEAMSKRVDAYV